MSAEFRTVSENEAGQWVRYRTVPCRCGTEGRIKDSAPRLLPAAPVASAFRRLGWTNVRPDRATCPACSTPGPKSAAPKEMLMVAEPPRQPTIEDKRRIRDALFAHYQEEKACYAKAHSDKSVASALNVPSAWVAAAREALGFGPDENETKNAFNTEVLAIRKDLAEAQDAILAKFDVLEKRLGIVERAGFKGAA